MAKVLLLKLVAYNSLTGVSSHTHFFIRLHLGAVDVWNVN